MLLVILHSFCFIISRQVKSGRWEELNRGRDCGEGDG